MKGIFFGFALFATVTLTAQTWNAKANSPDCRYDGVSFSIGNLVYYGLGIKCTGPQDQVFRVFDPAANSWDTIASFPGVTRRLAFAFSVGGKGYVGMGIAQNGNPLTDVWEYDPSLNSWTQKNNFPFAGRGSSFSCATATKGYVGAGLAYMQFFADYYEYDPVADTWTAQPSFPGGIRFQGSSFAIGGFTYALMGYDNNTTPYNDCWKFDTLANTWSACAAFPGAARAQASAFTLNGYGYAGYGGHSDFYRYDPAGNAWTIEVSNNDGAPIYDAACATASAGYCLSEYVSAPDTWEFLSSPQGIADAVTNEITVFPNPSTNGVFTIQISGSLTENMTITDMHGQLLAPVIIRRENQVIIDMRGYENGIYTAQLKGSSGPYCIRLVKLQ